MNKLLLRLVCAVIPLSALVLPWGCGGGGGGGEANPFGLKSEVVTPAAQADALAFAPDGRLFYAEHWTGTIRVISAEGQLLPEPFAVISNSASALSWGFTGLAIDPDFASNHYVYAYYTEIIDAGPPPKGRPTVIRFTDVGDTGVEPVLIVGDLPEANSDSPFNANGSLHFGPDGLLYLTLGDNDMARVNGPLGEPMPQDLGTAIGKMLRIQKDGAPPPDNPFLDRPDADPRIFAYGFRGNFNFAFHAATGKMFGTDNLGATCDKLNIVEKGANYAWPQALESSFDCSAVERTPIHFFAREGQKPGDFQSTVGIAGMEFVSGSVYPTLGDSLLVCESQTGLLRRLLLNAALDAVTEDDVVAEDCGLDITVSPDGIAYYSNSIEIRRLVPAGTGEAQDSEEAEESEAPEAPEERTEPTPTPPAE